MSFEDAPAPGGVLPPIFTRFSGLEYHTTQGKETLVSTNKVREKVSKWILDAISVVALAYAVRSPTLASQKTMSLGL